MPAVQDLESLFCRGLRHGPEGPQMNPDASEILGEVLTFLLNFIPEIGATAEDD